MSDTWMVLGASGRMGRLIIAQIEASGDTVFAAIDHDDHWPEMSGPKPDGIIDFSVAEVCREHVMCAADLGIPYIVGTTGLDAAAEEALNDASLRIPVFQSANMAYGVAVLAHMLKEIAPYLTGFSAEMTETHHIHKKDAPSGTAKMLAACLDPPLHVAIESIREGEVVGDHTLELKLGAETITLSHHAESRVLFADGALRAARYLKTQPPRRYTMEDLLDRIRSER